jgi:hypothetical protein
MRDTGKALIPCILCLCAAAGCTGSRGTAPRPRVGAGSTFIRATTAQFATVDGRVAVVVWSNFKGKGVTGSDSTSESTTVHAGGNCRSAGGAGVVWRWETADGKSGAVTVNGVSYDLANGPLFLVSAKGNDVRVRQLKRELGMPPEAEAFEGLAKDDPDVAGFVADAGKPRVSP